MPRIPQRPDCRGYIVVQNAAAEDIKLQQLEDKLKKEIEKKQNQLIAGENITIKDDVISAKGGGSGTALMGEDIVVDTVVGHLGPNAQISKFTPVADVVKQILYKEGSEEALDIWFYQDLIDPEDE